MKSVEIVITHTSKAFGSKEDYRAFDITKHNFKTREDAQQYLQDTYGKCKREIMYQDNVAGGAEKIGYIYCFNNKDISHNSAPWHQHDWVSVYSVEKTALVLK